MKRLNGWHRLGIVVSVIWFIGAGLTAYFYAINELKDERVRTCLDEEHQMLDKGADAKAADDHVFECLNGFHDDVKIARTDALFVGLVPILVAWLFTYVAVSLWKLIGGAIDASEVSDDLSRRRRLSR
jgi:hypothetical protein